MKIYRCTHCKARGKSLFFWDVKKEILSDTCLYCQEKGIETNERNRVEPLTLKWFKRIKPPEIPKELLPSKFKNHDKLSQEKIKKIKCPIRIKIRTVWSEMMRRCYSVKSASYHRYGARGITVCIEWHEFKNFYKWAIANGHTVGLKIDRINNDGNYEPLNCRFVTHKQNCNNTSKNRFITHNNETKTISQWADYYNISYSDFYCMLKQNNYKIKDCYRNTPLVVAQAE